MRMRGGTGSRKSYAMEMRVTFVANAAR